jgi:Kef-type K+ transport system membrane component KefB
MTGLAVFLGVTPMFGAFVAGIVTGKSHEEPEKPREAIKTFSYAFFIPIYFAIVGLKLDLITAFDPVFFLGFLGFACIVKALSVYLGAKLGGESPSGALNLAVAMNARGGPGIVLASLAFDAGNIDAAFTAVLAQLAIVTSLLAGSCLERVIRTGRPPR